MNCEKIIATIHELPGVFDFCRAGGERGAGADEKLRLLMIPAGQLAAVLRDRDWSKNNLAKIYGLCTGWLMALGEKTPVVKIIAERARQEKLLREGKFLFTCASRVADPIRKLRVLVEEIGEVAEAIDQLEIAESRRSLALKEYRLELRAEITQVAAVAVAWLESFEKPNRRNEK